MLDCRGLDVWTTEQARFQKDVLDKEGKAALADLRSKLNAAAAEEARLNARLDALYDQSTVGEQVLPSCVCVCDVPGGVANIFIRHCCALRVCGVQTNAELREVCDLLRKQLADAKLKIRVRELWRARH